MKLSVKITLAMVVLLGVLLAVGGHIMVEQNFNRNLEQTIEQNMQLHNAQVNLLRQNIAIRQFTSKTASAYDIANWGAIVGDNVRARGGYCAIMSGYQTALYNGLPSYFSRKVRAELLEIPQPGYALHQAIEDTFMVIPTSFSIGAETYWLFTAYDITPVFTERTMQTQTFYYVYAASVGVTLLLAAFVAAFITRPLRKLGLVTGQIAAGEYEQRTRIARQDEIGDLARNVDDMACAIQEKIDNLELAVQQREDFMGAFTHELKTPMTAMMGYASLLQKSNLDQAEKSKALSYIYNETKRLENLSQKLLAFLGLAETKIELEPTDLSHVFAKTKQALVEKDEYQVVFPSIKENDVMVMADEDLLTDLLLNLLQNGLRAKPIDGKVTIGVMCKPEVCTISVCDRGIGMSEEEQKRITEPFYCVDKSRARKESGNGLGLALCARIARAHGTDLIIHSKKGEGTTVYITIAAAPKQSKPDSTNNAVLSLIEKENTNPLQNKQGGEEFES